MMKQMINLVLVFATILAGFPAYPQFTVPQKAYVDLNNFIVNPGAELGKSGWATYADAAAASPVDGTGGAASSTYVSSTSSPLIGSASFLWTHSAANRQGEGFSYNFTIDTASKGKVLQGSFEYSIASGTFADDDLHVWIYDVTNAALIQPAPYKIKNHSLASERFPFEFQSSSSSTSYRLIVHVATSTATAYTAKFDNFKINQSAKLYGSTVTDWVAYTPTYLGLGTVTSVFAEWKRVGDTLHYRGKFTAGTPTAASASFSLPTGITASALEGSTAYAGEWKRDSTNEVNQGPLLVNTNNSSTIIYFGNAGSMSAGGISPLNIALGNTIVGAGGNITFSGYVKVLGWSSSVIISSDAATNVVAARAYLAANQTGVNPNNTYVKILFDTVDYDYNGAWDAANKKYTVNVSGVFSITANASIASTNVLASQYALVIYKNGALAHFGNGLSPVVNTPFSLTTGTNLKLVAGDYIEIYLYGAGNNSSSTLTCSGGSSVSSLAVSRISGPAQIAASETVSALYVGQPTGTLNAGYNTATLPTKVKDTHGAYSAGTYTVPVSGTYTISAQLAQQATYSLNKLAITAIHVDGVVKYPGVIYVGGVISTAYPNVCVLSVPLLAGQLITIKAYNDATSPTYNTDVTASWFSIVKTGNY